MAPIKGINLIKTIKNFSANAPAYYIACSLMAGVVSCGAGIRQKGIKVEPLNMPALERQVKTDWNRGMEAISQFNLGEATKTNTGKGFLWIFGFFTSDFLAKFVTRK